MAPTQLDAQVKLVIFHNGGTESELFREAVRVYCTKVLEDIRKKEAEEALLKKVKEQSNENKPQ
jgi:hypothetical protein